MITPPQPAMDAPLDLESAGREFDKWLDWNGTANASNDMTTIENTAHKLNTSTTLPISPSSTTSGDVYLSQIKTDFLTAPPSHDLLTPRHSSASPESRSSVDMRLSGDTLRDEVTPSQRPMLKRKLSPTDVPMTDYRYEAPTPAVKKRPHNIIEKRYRANLNEKIIELRDSVPSLRLAQKSKVREAANGDSDEDELDGLTPSNKLNKASILTKAVEYIRHLEFRTKRLEDENKSLNDRLETLDKVIAHGGNDAQRATAFTSDVVIEESSTSTTAQSESSNLGTALTESPQGLIPLSDTWKRFRQQQQPAEHYGHIYQTPAERSRFKGRWPTRIMLGSLAALMVMDGLNESDMGTESREKGLFGIPLELLDGWTFLRSPRIYLAGFSQYCQTGGVIPLMKGFVALTILAFLVFSYLFNSKPQSKSDLEEATSEQAPSPSSPIQVRRRAWSTSMQELHLPHHSFFPEWLAITSEWLKYTFGYLCGSQAYAWLTGRTADDNLARIKAWDIAIDAQLAGGDTEISRSRLLLTIFGAGNLPRTPIRLMLKALHCRVLLWNMGTLGSGPSSIANRVGKFFAHRQWHRARDSNNNLPLHHVDRLPSHLSEMLDLPCEEACHDTVCQRAYNLMYDQPTQENSIDPLLDVVVEDHAIRSPLDAVAAWRSSLSLKQALVVSLSNPTATELIQEHLTAALRLAPPGSAAQTRTLATSAVLSISGRDDFLVRATDAMASLDASCIQPEAELRPPFIIDSSTPKSARSQILNCLHCARTLQIFDNDHSPSRARAFFESQDLDVTNVDLVTRAVSQYLLWRISTETPAKAGREEVGLLPHDRRFLADVSVVRNSCSTKSRRFSTVSIDSGYESHDASASAWDIDLESRCSQQLDTSIRQEFMV